MHASDRGVNVVVGRRVLECWGWRVKGGWCWSGSCLLGVGGVARGWRKVHGVNSAGVMISAEVRGATGKSEEEPLLFACFALSDCPQPPSSAAQRNLFPILTFRHHGLFCGWQ